MVQLRFNTLTVGIQGGELVSFVKDGHEFIHQKGSPGWGSSDTEMFPIIGPVDKTGYKVTTPRGVARQDQHGLLRQMPYALISNGGNSAVFRKEYRAGSRVANAKYPDKSELSHMDWPYSFVFEKSYYLGKDALDIVFKISGDPGMPFMLGYHPAFKLHAPGPRILAQDREIPLEEVLAVGDRALELADCTRVTLRDRRELTLETEGFGHFMCWTPVENMLCLEPISFYPYALPQDQLHKGFRVLDGEAEFRVVISPGPLVP